jgi:pimeloyl-ACP methyl ester carboxylesterase
MLWSRYPRLELVTLVGHSSGGQAVQRYALTTKMAVEARVRYVVANPSSFAYLNGERWLDQGKPTERLATPPASVTSGCPRYHLRNT